MRSFLEAAAHRHDVFNYEKIAEFYCHASPEIQRLIEASALIIIDYDQAIERGYIEITKKLAELAGEQQGAASEDVDDDE